MKENDQIIKGQMKYNVNKKDWVHIEKHYLSYIQ